MAFTPDDGSEDGSLQADINVTPLVDVMLVLLIIFMVAAPMLQQGVKVDLPRVASQPLPTDRQQPFVLTLQKDGLVYADKTPIHPSQFEARLLPMAKAKAKEGVFLRADKEIPYGRVIELLELLRRGGVVDVGLVTEPPSAPTRRAPSG